MFGNKRKYNTMQLAYAFGLLYM